jgi:hypothetical protein
MKTENSYLKCRYAHNIGWDILTQLLAMDIRPKSQGSD